MEKGKPLFPWGRQLLRQNPRVASRGSSSREQASPEERAEPLSSFQKFMDQNWVGFNHLHPNVNSPFHMQGTEAQGE